MGRLATYTIITLIKRYTLIFPVAVALTLLASMGCRPQGGVVTRLAAKGTALQPVVVSPKASPQVRASAAELAKMLTLITAAPFEVIEGNGTRGIVVGVYSNFAAEIDQFNLTTELPIRREDHIIRSHANGLWLIGTTDSAVDQAIWGFLNHLGVRLFFLTDTWEVIPRLPLLRVALDVCEKSDDFSRLAPCSAPWSDRALWQRWQKRNRVVSGFAPCTGHADNQGAQYRNPEYSDSWGTNGLGYWIMPQLLWRVAGTENLEPLVDDFLDKAFGPALEPMRMFYTLLNLNHELHTAEHVAAMMYRHLAEARQLAIARPDVMARLDDLVLYTRYGELYTNYREASGDTRQATFETLWRHAYRMRDRIMLSTVAICRRGRHHDLGVSLPEGAEWDTPEADHPWKDSRSFRSEEIDALVSAGIAANQPMGLTFEPVEFSDKLVPATQLTLPTNFPVVDMPLTGCDTRTFLTWLEEPGSIVLEITGGLITDYRDRSNVKINLFAAEETTLTAVAQDESVPPDGTTYPVTLQSPYAGLHTLEISDGSDRTRLAFPTNLPLTVHSGLAGRARLDGRWSLYFYVPYGTRIVGGFTINRTGRIRDQTGKVVFDFTTMERNGTFSVPVEEGHDGTFWRLENCVGARRLMTVPPYLADHPTRLLLPREVVEKDSRVKR